MHFVRGRPPEFGATGTLNVAIYFMGGFSPSKYRLSPGNSFEMKPSTSEAVRDMYEATADSYAAMMDDEIDLPVYSDTLGRLSERLANTPGTLIDTSCGSGHMLSMYRERYDSVRPLLGIDLSPRMAGIASAKLGSCAEISIGDMRELDMVGTGSAAAVVSYFSIHHLEPKGVSAALSEWHRALAPGGQVLIAAWEGVGAIDYGDASDVVALRYRSDELSAWTESAGLSVSRCVVEPVEGMPMDAVFLEGCKG